MAQIEEPRKLIEEIEPDSIMPPGPVIESDMSGPAFMHGLFSARSQISSVNEQVPAWWSPRRDQYLWETLLRSDLLSSSIYVTSSRLQSIPVYVKPYDQDSAKNRKIAEIAEILIRNAWNTEILKFIVDWQTQDNGAFMEVLGAGRPTGPIEPTLIPGSSNTYIFATGLKHLDSQRCQRTGDRTYPVLYRHTLKNGQEKLYKLHYSRVIFTSQLESGRADMYGVGFSGVSRCISNILHMQDIEILKGEWLGSRPISQIIFGKGISAQQLEDAFVLAEERMSSEGLKRHAKSVFIGITGNADMVRAADIETKDIKRLPEGYDEQTSTNIAINMVAMSLGFDARELWPATVSGATRGDALIQHMKTMRKTPGVWVDTMISQLMHKFVPATCFPSFDQQDDEQDRVRAENSQLRAETLEIRLRSGQIDLPTAYELQLEAGDINESQYKKLLKKYKEDEQRRREMEAMAAEVNEANGSVSTTGANGAEMAGVQRDTLEGTDIAPPNAPDMQHRDGSGKFN